MFIPTLYPAIPCIILVVTRGLTLYDKLWNIILLFIL
jgi:hypothetical protein